MFNFKKVVNLALSVSILGSVVAPTISFSGLFGKTTPKKIDLTKNQKAKLMLLNAAKKTGAGIALTGKYAGKGLLGVTKAVGKGIFGVTKATVNGSINYVKSSGKSFNNGFYNTLGSVSAFGAIGLLSCATFAGFILFLNKKGVFSNIGKGFADGVKPGLSDFLYNYGEEIKKQTGQPNPYASFKREKMPKNMKEDSRFEDLDEKNEEKMPDLEEKKD